MGIFYIQTILVILGVGWKKYNFEFDGLEKYLNRISQKKSRIDQFRPLPTHALHKVKESITLEWTYNSNAIEGNSLTLQETKVVIEEGFTIKGKSLREHFEVLNHQEAITFIEQLVSQDYVLNAKDILDVHGLVLQKIEKENSGRYRTMGARISGANFVPPNALKVDELIDELIDWQNQESHLLHPVVANAIFHHRFVWVHPFIDGNGRTVRLISNLLLMKTGYPPAIILKLDRKKYYAALNKANQGDYAKLLVVVLQSVERSLDIYLSNLTNTYDEYLPISDIVEEPDVPYSQEYVSLLVRQGKIDAFKEGKNWLTTKAAVHSYIKGRERKRKLGS